MKLQKLKNLTYWSLFLIIAFMALGGVMNKIEAYEQRAIHSQSIARLLPKDDNRGTQIQRRSNYNNRKDEEITTEIEKNKIVKLLTNNPDIETKIREIADQENFKWTDYLVKLAFCESRLNPKATNDNGKYGLDRGIFQINNKYHPAVTDAQAFDIDFATRWTINKINGGYQHLWACDNIIKRNLVKL